MEEYAIETRALTKRYGARLALSDLCLHVKPGRVYGLLGRNGAGKTTAMKLLLGLTTPTSGEALLFGRPLRGNERALLPRVGSLIEAPGFYPNLTGTENLRVFAALRNLKGDRAVRDALSLVGLPYRDGKLFAQYSLGMKQRLAIALAVMHDPELLILDEPTNGLDPVGIAEMRAFLRKLCTERGKTALISSHLLPELSLLADDVGILDRGALLEEESMAELERRSRRGVRFTVSDPARAEELLRTAFGAREVTREGEGSLLVPDATLSVARAVALFVESGVSVSEARLCEETLEDYFRRVTGGEGIG